MIQESLPAPLELLERHRLEMAKLGGILVAAIREKACKYVIRCVLSAIVGHCREGFRDEENLMRVYGYPVLVNHAAEHELFLSSMAALIDRETMRDPGKECVSYELTVEAIQLVMDWTRGHIDGIDNILEGFLLQRAGSVCLL